MYALSAQECIDCKADGCTANRTTSDCLTYIQSNRISTNATYPYTGTAGKCASKAKTPVEVTSIQTVAPQNETEIVAHLNDGPLIASIDASQSVFIHYSTGILNALTCKTGDNNHYVLIVGYGSDTADGSDYYIVRNSWGTRWGLVGQALVEGGDGSGYGYIARNGDGVGICGI